MAMGATLRPTFADWSVLRGANLSLDPVPCRRLEGRLGAHYCLLVQVLADMVNDARGTQPSFLRRVFLCRSSGASLGPAPPWCLPALWPLGCWVTSPQRSHLRGPRTDVYSTQRWSCTGAAAGAPTALMGRRAYGGGLPGGSPRRGS